MSSLIKTIIDFWQVDERSSSRTINCLSFLRRTKKERGNNSFENESVGEKTNIPSVSKDIS
jgi:hypothetical protein